MADDEMTDEDTPVLPFEQQGPFQESSLVDQLRADLAEITANETVYIPVIGYERTGLQVKYHLPENGKILDAITRKVFREHRDIYSRNLFTSMDMMIALCAGLYVQPPEVDVPVELDPQLSGSPVQFDERLAEIIGLNGDRITARGVVRKLFAGNDLAIMDHAQKLDRWLRNTSADLTTDWGQMGE